MEVILKYKMLFELVVVPNVQVRLKLRGRGCLRNSKSFNK